MNYLIYVSSATQHFSEEDLKALLITSRKNNTALGITGMLLYAEGNFIQVIEGEPGAINGLYSKIAQDPRHRGVFPLLKGEIQTRNFSQWSMGFKSISTVDYSMLTGFEKPGILNSQSAATLINRPILHLLKNFLKINSAEARYI